MGELLGRTYRKNIIGAWTVKGIREALRQAGVEEGRTLRFTEYIRPEARGEHAELRSRRVKVLHIYPHLVQLQNEHGLIESPSNATLLLMLRSAQEGGGI